MPLTPVANQAAPKNPAHSPARVEMMYQLGGSLRWEMAVRELVLPSTAAVMETTMTATIWPPTNPRAANSSHIQAALRSMGAAPAAN